MSESLHKKTYFEILSNLFLLTLIIFNLQEHDQDLSVTSILVTGRRDRVGNGMDKGNLNVPLNEL
jgi:hypothetical protein